MEEEDTREYVVLVNCEEQYSLWLADLDIPKGWREVFARNNKKACLEYVKEVWTDMRPLSLRKAMAEANAQREQEAQVQPPPQEQPPAASAPT